MVPHSNSAGCLKQPILSLMLVKARCIARCLTLCTCGNGTENHLNSKTKTCNIILLSIRVITQEPLKPNLKTREGACLLNPNWELDPQQSLCLPSYFQKQGTTNKPAVSTGITCYYEVFKLWCEEKDFSRALFLAPDSTLSDVFCINSGFQEAFKTAS